MVVIHPVATGDELQAAAAMFRKRLEHVIEEFYIRRYLNRAAVEPETQIHLRLFGGALDRGVAFD
jgi:hypothetical protein